VELERQTLHVLDGVQRIAMVETKTREGGTVIGTPTPRLRFQLGNHLGSASLEVTETGAVISFEEYTPYGVTAYRSSNGRGSLRPVVIARKQPQRQERRSRLRGHLRADADHELGNTQTRLLATAARSQATSSPQSAPLVALAYPKPSEPISQLFETRRETFERIRGFERNPPFREHVDCLPNRPHLRMGLDVEVKMISVRGVEARRQQMVKRTAAPDSACDVA